MGKVESFSVSDGSLGDVKRGTEIESTRSGSVNGVGKGSSVGIGASGRERCRWGRARAG